MVVTEQLVEAILVRAGCASRAVLSW